MSVDTPSRGRFGIRRSAPTSSEGGPIAAGGRSAIAITDRLAIISAGRARTLFDAHEADRRQIARDLHDVVGQALTAARLSVLRVRRDLPSEVAHTTLDDSLSAIDHAIKMVRAFAIDLRPAVLDDLGLEASLRWHLGRIAQAGDLNVAFEAEVGSVSLNPDLEGACFRIVQEAVTNCVRHARARSVLVSLSIVGRYLTVTVRDDGIGFDVEQAILDVVRGQSLGLASMSERARAAHGTLEITSAPAGGTTLRALLPLHRPVGRWMRRLGR